eukprot:6460340-Amphidinium_carterae.1
MFVQQGTDGRGFQPHPDLRRTLSYVISVLCWKERNSRRSDNRFRFVPIVAEAVLGQTSHAPRSGRCQRDLETLRCLRLIGTSRGVVRHCRTGLKLIVKGSEVLVVFLVLVARGVKEKRHVHALSRHGTRTVQPVATAALKRASTI